jgi:hypothetical protein
MKILLIALVCLFQSTAYSFETGKYHAESADGSQSCQLDIEQKANSHIIHKLNCEDSTLGRSITADTKEWLFGTTKKYFPEFKMTMTIEVAENLHKMNYSNKKRTESYDKEFTAKDKKTIHFKYSVIHEGTMNVWFDMDLKPSTH